MTPEYWRDQLSAYLADHAPYARETYIINDADPERQPDDARLVVRARADHHNPREALRRLATRARRCGFVIVPRFGIDASLLVLDRDRLAYSYHSNHSGIIGEAEP